MAARALDHYLEGVRGGHYGAGLRRRYSKLQSRPQMQREDLAHVLGDALLDHGPPSGVTLLGGLEDEPHGAAQPFAQVILAEGASSADEHARMPVVAAGVHLPVYLRGERKIRRLMDRQSVHVGPQGHCRPVASSTLQGCDDTVLGNAGLYLQRQAVQSVEYLLGGLFGVEAELGLSMYVAPEDDDIVPEALPDLLFEALEPLGYFHGASFPRHNCLPLLAPLF